jgi:hypothetical protein
LFLWHQSTRLSRNCVSVVAAVFTVVVAIFDAVVAADVDAAVLYNQYLM